MPAKVRPLHIESLIQPQRFTADRDDPSQGGHSRDRDAVERTGPTPTCTARGDHVCRPDAAAQTEAGDRDARLVEPVRAAPAVEEEESPSTSAPATVGAGGGPQRDTIGSIRPHPEDSSPARRAGYTRPSRTRPTCSRSSTERSSSRACGSLSLADITGAAAALDAVERHRIRDPHSTLGCRPVVEKDRFRVGPRLLMRPGAGRSTGPDGTASCVDRLG